MEQKINRRQHARFAVTPSYTSARVRLMTDEQFTLTGHVYDVSEGGVRFELDTPVEPGTPVAMEIALPEHPGSPPLVDGPGRAVYLIGNVVWCDADEPGPAQMALAITRFARAGDRDRLMRRITSGAYARVA